MTIVVLKLILSIVIILASVSAAPLVLMLVWNAVVAGMFDGPEITFWAAFGILIALGIIGGALRGSGKAA